MTSYTRIVISQGGLSWHKCGEESEENKFWLFFFSIFCDKQGAIVFKNISNNYNWRITI